MKISKVRHTRAAVGKKENEDVKGILYEHPGKGEHKLSGRIDYLDGRAKGLYNILTPIELGTLPTEPVKPSDSSSEEEMARYKRKVENYNIKLNNYERRAKFVGKDKKNAIKIINDELKGLLFVESNSNGKKIRKMKSNNDIFLAMPSAKKIKYSKEDLEELITLALRKSIKEARIKKGSILVNSREGAVLLLCNIGKNNCSEDIKKKIEEFLNIVRADFNKISDSKATVIRSIENQNLVIQAQKNKDESYARLGVATVNNDGKEKKSQITKNSDREGLVAFLNLFADLNMDNRVEVLRKVRRIIDLYFAAPVKSIEEIYKDDPIIPTDVDTTQFNIWLIHEKGKSNNETFVPVPDIFDVEKSGRQAVDSVEKKNSSEQLIKAIAHRNAVCFCYAKRCIEKYNDCFFEDGNINFFWIRHISSAIERIMKHRTVENIFKLDLGYLKEKIWKDALNYICIKYIAMGKMVFNYGMDELTLDKSEITLGVLGDKVSEGISSFDLEIIKARESLQREVSVYLAFAANNLARATVKVPEDDSDILLWGTRADKIRKNRSYEDMDGLLMRILQFFGGKSKWEDGDALKFFRDKYNNEDDFLMDLIKIIYALRNENFHFQTNNIDNNSWNEDVVKYMFSQDIKRCEELYKERFCSNNLPSFYDIKSLKQLLGIIYSRQYSRAAQIPSFGNVLPRTKFEDFVINYLKYNVPEYDEKEKEMWYNALYFLFKESYYNGFLQSENTLNYVIDATNEIKKEAGEKAGNCPQDEDAQNEKYAADDFYNRVFIKKDGKTIFAFSDLSKLCQAIMTEYNYQNNQVRKVKPGTKELFDKEIFKHYKVFLIEIIKRALASYIKDEYNFLATPNKNIIDSSSYNVSDFDGLELTRYNKLAKQINNAYLQKWYIVGRLLNTKYLNLLVGSMRSYLQYVSDIKHRAQSRSVIINGDKANADRIKEVIKILDMCIELSSMYSNVVEDYFESDEQYAKYLSSYLEYSKENKSYMDLLGDFCKIQDESGDVKNRIYMDESHPIVNRNVIISKLFGPESILEQVFIKVTHEDLKDYYKAQENIATYRKCKKCANKKEQLNLNKFMRLKNHVELQEVVEYSEIINELQGQLINYSFLRERDLLYFQIGFHYMCLGNTSAKPDEYKQIVVSEGAKEKIINNAILYQISGLYINGIGVCVPNKKANSFTEKAKTVSPGTKISTFGAYDKLIAEKLLSEEASDGNSECIKNIDDYIYNAGLEVFENVKEHENIIDLRNAIDHFKYYTQSEYNGDKLESKEYLKSTDYIRSILDYYSEIFDRFFTYDMKYKKNVINILENILLRHRIVAEFGIGTAKKVVGRSDDKKDIKAIEKDRANIILTRCESDKYTYKLIDEDNKTTKEKLDAVDEKFITTVKKLLEYPYVK